MYDTALAKSTVNWSPASKKAADPACMDIYLSEGAAQRETRNQLGAQGEVAVS